MTDRQTDLEGEGLQLGSIQQAADVLVGGVEGEGGVAEEAVGGDQGSPAPRLPEEPTVEFGEEEAELVGGLVVGGAKLEHLRTHTTHTATQVVSGEGGVRWGTRGPAHH